MMGYSPRTAGAADAARQAAFDENLTRTKAAIAYAIQAIRPARGPTGWLPNGWHWAPADDPLENLRRARDLLDEEIAAQTQRKPAPAGEAEAG